MRLIDADKIPFSQSEDGCLNDVAYRYDINEMQTIDPVHAAGAIYCSECIYWDRYEGMCYLRIESEKERPLCMKSEDFCSYGVKRETGGVKS